MNTGNDKIRTWLLGVVIVIFVASIGALGYRVIDGISSGTNGTGIFGTFKNISSQMSTSNANSFNQSYEIYAGSRSGSIAESVMTDIITQNKKSSTRQISVTFDGIECGTDIDCIAEQKKKIDEWGDYEISFEYDSSGYIYLMEVEKL